MIPTEKMLFKEAVIREYRMKHETQKKPFEYHKLLLKLKKIAPSNFALGVAAPVLLVYYQGWQALVVLLLSGLIWITVISTIVSAMLKE